MLTSGSGNVPFSTIGGNNSTYPQGRKVTQWQINDNLTWTHGKHTLQFGINTRRLDVSGRNSVQGPNYVDSDIYITKTFSIRERAKLRLDAQMFNAFNHPNFALPSEVEAGVPGGAIPARFGTLESTISPPTGLLGVGLGGDSSSRMIAFQARIEF